MPALLKKSDEELVLLLNGGCKAAYAEIYRRYYESLSRHAYKVLKGDDAARDLVQDVFASLWEKRETVRISSSLNAYLYCSIRNAVLDEIKRSKRQEDRLDALARFMADHAEPADLLLRNKQLSDLIEQEVSQLPGRMREVYLLRRDEELSHAEIAERLGISRLTVKTQMNKALRILREKLSFFFVMLVILAFFS